MPHSKQDPTGQAKNRIRATNSLSKRVRKAEKRIMAEFKAIQNSSESVVKVVNAVSRTVYSYEYSPEEFERLVQFILNDELLQTQVGLLQFSWFFKSDIERAYRKGTAEEVRDFNRLLNIAEARAAGIIAEQLPQTPPEIEQVLLSESYRKTLNGAQMTSFANIKTLSNKTAAQVMHRINAGIQAGNSPKDIAAEITDRFGVAKSSARRIAETEVNKAYNDAKLDTNKLMSKSTGLRGAVVHISALLPTTRSHHAARHGNAYTVEDQLAWWEEGANRINCKCTTKSVLIDSEGNVVHSEIQQEIKDDKSFFENL